MKRCLIVSFAVVLPLVIFGTAKWATRWRPVTMNKIQGAQTIFVASNDYLSIYTGGTDLTILDLKTGEQIN